MDLVIIDTAGRLQTNTNLMEELKKIKRVIGKVLPGAPHETLLVLDATIGQNSISQARLFNEALTVDGLVMTKLDGTAKGGVLFNITDDLKLPIRFVGVGEKPEDLQEFNPETFVEALIPG
jgi:fused signal recognition particle receptor